MSARRRIPGQDYSSDQYTVVTVGTNSESVNKFTNNWLNTSHYQNSPSSSESFYSSPPPEEIEFIMTARDRTAEFSNAIRSMQGRNIARATNIRDPRKARQLQSYSEFMNIAKIIGKNIANTYSKLEKLTHCNIDFLFVALMILFNFYFNFSGKN